MLIIFSTNAFGLCEVKIGEKRIPFNGKDIIGLSIEKKSLSEVNKKFPDLNIIEKTFKGEVQTCTICSDNYVTCKSF